MKKNTIKAFTLVEMLIVIVIIGILIASLMPRMQSAQGRARDVARKNDLSQIQTAIITSQQDKGRYPGMEDDAETKATQGIPVASIASQLQIAGMSSVPKDPNGANEFTGLNAQTFTGGDYAYMVQYRSSIKDGGFILMAKTETEGGSNRVQCGDDLEHGKIEYGAGSGDLANVKLCTSFVKTGTSTTDCATAGDDGKCEYYSIEQLRYILMY